MARWKPAASQVAYQAGFQRIPTGIRSIHSLSTCYQQSNKSTSGALANQTFSKDNARETPRFDTFLSIRNTTSKGSRKNKTASWTSNRDGHSGNDYASSSQSKRPTKITPVIPRKLAQPRTRTRTRTQSQLRPSVVNCKPTSRVEPSQPETTSFIPTIDQYTPSFSAPLPSTPIDVPQTGPSISKRDLLALIQHVRPLSPSSSVGPKLPLTFYLPADLLQAVQTQKQGDSKNLLESLLVKVMNRSHQAQQALKAESASSRQHVDSFSQPSLENKDPHSIRTADVDMLILRILSPAYENSENISLLLNILPMLLSFVSEHSRYMSPKTIAFLLFNSSDPIKGFEYLDSQCHPEDLADMFSPTELNLVWKAWVTSSQSYRVLLDAHARLSAMGLPANEETFHDHLLGIFLRHPAVPNLKTVVKHLPQRYVDASRTQPAEFVPTVQDALVRLFGLAEIAGEESLKLWASRRICHLSSDEPIERQTQSVRREIRVAAEVVVLDLTEQWKLPEMRKQIKHFIRYFDPVDSIIIPPGWAGSDLLDNDAVSNEASLNPVDLNILDRISRTWANDRKGRLWKALIKGSASEDGQSWKSVFQIYLLGSKGIHHNLQRPDQMVFPVIDTLDKNLNQYAGDQKKEFAQEVLKDKAFIHILMTTPAVRPTPSDGPVSPTSSSTIVPLELSVHAGNIIRTILTPFLEVSVLPRTGNKLYDALLDFLSRLTTYRPVLELNQSKDALRHLLTLAPSPALKIRTIRTFFLLRPDGSATSSSAATADDDSDWSRSIFSPRLVTETVSSILSRLSSTPDVSQPGPILDMIDLSNETNINVNTRLGWLRQLLERYFDILILLGPPGKGLTPNSSPRTGRNENRNENGTSDSKGKINMAYRAHQLGEIRTAIAKVESWLADRPDLFAPSTTTAKAGSGKEIRKLINRIKLKTQNLDPERIE